MLLYYSGFEWLLKNIIGTRNITIIMFHSVNINKFLPSKSNFSTPPEIFRKKLLFLSRYKIISMDKLIEFYENGESIPKNCVVLTFDDGYQDNYKFAFPILKELNIPATIFVATDYIDSDKWLPLNILYYLITTTKKEHITITKIESNQEHQLTLITNNDKDIAKSIVAGLYKKTPSKKRKTFFNELQNQLIDKKKMPLPDDLKMLNRKEIDEMHRSGLICFGSHTASHVLLAMSSEEKVAQELKESKCSIEKMLNHPIKHFAYPNGHPEDFSVRDKSILQHLGYKTACTTIEGTNKVSPQTDMFELKRFSWKMPNYLLAVKMLLSR